MIFASLMIAMCFVDEPESISVTESRARAAVAVALSLQQATPLKQPRDQPWVRVYVPNFPCRACEQVKADTRRGLFPFRLISGPAPPGFEIECYPTFHWNNQHGHGCRWPPLGSDDAYPGPDKLIAIWKRSRDE